MSRERLDEALVQDSGGRSLGSVMVNPANGQVIGRWQSYDTYTENGEEVIVPLVAFKPAATIGCGTKAVTTAGTRETLVAATTPCLAVTIQAKRANTGYVYVGGATVASTDGVDLAPGESMTLGVDDLVKIYLDVSVNGEGVKYTYVV